MQPKNTSSTDRTCLRISTSPDDIFVLPSRPAPEQQQDEVTPNRLKTPSGPASHQHYIPVGTGTYGPRRPRRLMMNSSTNPSRLGLPGLLSLLLSVRLGSLENELLSNLVFEQALNNPESTFTSKMQTKKTLLSCSCWLTVSLTGRTVTILASSKSALQPSLPRPMPQGSINLIINLCTALSASQWPGTKNEFRYSVYSADICHGGRCRHHD